MILQLQFSLSRAVTWRGRYSGQVGSHANPRPGNNPPLVNKYSATTIFDIQGVVGFISAPAYRLNSKIIADMVLSEMASCREGFACLPPSLTPGYVYQAVRQGQYIDTSLTLSSEILRRQFLIRTLTSPSLLTFPVQLHFTRLGTSLVREGECLRPPLHAVVAALAQALASEGSGSGPGSGPGLGSGLIQCWRSAGLELLQLLQ